MNKSAENESKNVQWLCLGLLDLKVLVSLGGF